MTLKRALLIIFLILLLDQALKIWIKTHFYYGETYHITSWFKLMFVENEGMAFGMSWGGSKGKLFLTFFRIFAVGALFYWLIQIIKKGNDLLALAVTFILGGAIGNLIDSIFYGKFFTQSTHQVARFVKDGSGYGDWFQGKVVDMFYFPLFKIKLPDWFPYMGGEYFTFFNAIFNLADSFITIGVLIIILFNKRIFKKS